MKRKGEYYFKGNRRVYRFGLYDWLRIGLFGVFCLTVCLFFIVLNLKVRGII